MKTFESRFRESHKRFNQIRSSFLLVEGACFEQPVHFFFLSAAEVTRFFDQDFTLPITGFGSFWLDIFHSDPSIEWFLSLLALSPDPCSADWHFLCQLIRPETKENWSCQSLVFPVVALVPAMRKEAMKEGLSDLNYLASRMTAMPWLSEHYHPGWLLKESQF